MTSPSPRSLVRTATSSSQAKLLVFYSIVRVAAFPAALMGAIFSSLAHAQDKCPVDHKNISEQELEGMMAQYKRLGHAAFIQQHQASKSSQVREQVSTTSETPVANRCPVDHQGMSEEQVATDMASSQMHDVRSLGEGKKKRRQETVYDVYGQELDKANLMPATPNQLPAPGQKHPLSTNRVISSIPKAGGGENETWTYPSPQMFYNALKRKGKADGVREADVDTVVSVHNTMNERTWREVMEWERRFHCAECDNPKLKQFMGKPHELSPAARFRTWFRGYPMPFDRHDWIVDRCGKGEARYIIDYYYREGSDPIEIHVRPAVDSLPAAWDRLRHGAIYMRNAVFGEGLATQPSDQRVGSVAAHGWGEHVVHGETLDSDEFAFLSNLTPKDVQEIATDVQQKCAKVGQAFRDAGDDPTKMEQANVSINYCMAQRICKSQANDFMAALEQNGDEMTAYEKMTACLDRFHIMARRTILESTGVKQSGPEFPAGAVPSVASNPNPSPASSVE